MAYAVAASLSRTIFRLVKDSRICLDENSSREFLESVYEGVESLKQLLKKYDRSSSIGRSRSSSRSIDRKRVNAVDTQIREALCQFEDILEFHVSHQIDSQIQPAAGDDSHIIHHPLLFTLDFEQLTQQLDSFGQTLTELITEYIRELCQDEGEDGNDDYYYQNDDEYIYDDDNYVVEGSYDADDYDLKQEEEEEEEAEAEEEDEVMNGVDDDDESNSDDMVGLSDMFIQLKNLITYRNDSDAARWKMTCITGMAGIGKTALAKKLFRDPEIAAFYEKRAFVTIGQNYRLEDVLLDILRQVNPGKLLTEVDMKQKSVANLKRMVYRSLKKRKCFIVLDDLWNTLLFTKEISSVFLCDLNDDCHILLTSRLPKVAFELATKKGSYVIPFLNKKESWHLLRKKVFGDEESLCPPQLVKAGEKIAEHCDGLPLTILKVADILLSTEDTTLEFWNEVAAQKQHPIFLEAYEQMLEVLYPSYDYLPQYLRVFFLYIGVFPQNYNIPCSELTSLWSGERLFGGSPFLVIRYLSRLYNRSLVLYLANGFYDKTKRIGLHSTFWYMCNKEARNNKFYYCLNVCADTLAEDMESQRRLCVQNNVLFAIKDVHTSISSISTVRSLLCTGAYHQHPVPICLGLRLLKVVHALTIRFYEFPMEALNRVHLNYFALTLDGELPSSISRLWNLQFLIVHRHVKIAKSQPSYMPMEIWKMKKLGHLHVMGNDLPNPCQGSDDDHILPNLQVLLDVSARSCTEDIFKRTPTLKKLRIQIELAPDDHEPLCFFDDISHLHNLAILQCFMTTPKIMSGVVAPPAPLSIYSSSLVKLTLSGMGYPWEEMSKISSSLPSLRILKLRCYAFRGPEWVVVDKEFPQLRSLFIEDTDLAKWTSLQDYYSLENLQWLTIKHCYNLREIPITLFGESLKRIELVDCNPSAHRCAEQLKEHLCEQYNAETELRITSSWS